MLVKGVLIIRTRRSILMVVAVFLLASLPLGVTSADSLPPSVSISVTPEQEYYDAFENETFQQSIEFRINWLNLQEGTNYTVQLYIMKEYQTYGEDGMKSSANIFLYPMNPVKNLNDFADTGTLGAIENNTNYTYFAKLRTEEQGQGDSFIYLAQYNFTIGQEPVAEPQPLQNLALNCDLGDDNIWDMYTEDYGTIPYKTTILGEIECNLTNSNSVTAFYNLSDFAYLGDGALQEGAGFDIPSWLHNSNSIPAFSTGESFNISLDCGEPSHCEETNGTLGFVIQTYSEDETNWSESEIQHYIDYSIENNSIIPPVIIRGCMNETAENFNANATEDDGSCIFPDPPEPEPEPTPPDCPLCNLTYFIPREMSVGTPATLNADVTASDGWKYFGGANVSWNISGTVVNGSEIEYTFTTIPEGGSANVSFCTYFDDIKESSNGITEGSEDCIWGTIAVNESLGGYLSQSSLLAPIILDNVGGVHFDVSASGGLAPYSYQWQFGDGNSSTNGSVVHEFADWGLYNVTLIITDARNDSMTLDTYVEILEPESSTEESIDVEDEEISEPQIHPFGVVATGGGTLALVLLTRHNGRKKMEKMLQAARLKLREERAQDGDELW